MHDTSSDERRARRMVTLIAAIITTLVIAAVVLGVDRRTDTGSDLADGVPATADRLLGRRFESIGPLPGAPAPDGVLAMTFRPPEPPGGDGLIGVGGATSPGCNGGSGLFVIESDGTLTAAEEIWSTLMGCPGLAEAMDTWVIDVLQSTPRLLPDGDDLTVITRTASLHLREVPIPTPPPRPAPTQSIEPGGNCTEVADSLAIRLVDLAQAVDLQAFVDAGGDAAPAETLTQLQSAVEEAQTIARCDPSPLLLRTEQHVYLLAIQRFADLPEAKARYALIGHLLIAVLPPDVPLFVPTIPPTAPPTPLPSATPAPPVPYTPPVITEVPPTSS